MSFKGQLLIARAGFIVPEPLIAKSIPLFGNAWGGAIAEGGWLDVFHKEEPPTVASVMALQTTCLDNNLVMWLGSGEKFQKDDYQPYTLISRKNEEQLDEPWLVGFAEGDFTSSFKKGSNRPNEFFYMNTLLRPKVNKILGHLNGDFEGLMNEIQDPTSYEDYASAFGDRGVLVLLSKDDVIHLIMKDESGNHINADWGFASQSLEAPELPEAGSEEAPITVDMSPPKRMSKFGGKVATATSVPKTGPAPTASPPVIQNITKLADARPKTDTTAAQHTLTEVFMKPPEVLKSRGELNSWYGTYATLKVKDINVTAKPPVRIKPEMVQQCLAKGGIKVDMKPIASTEPVKPAAPAPFTPMLDAKELSDFNTFIQTLDANALKVKDPDQIPSIEAEAPTFTDLAKLDDLAYLNGLSTEAFFDLCRVAPKAATLLFVEYRAALAALAPEPEAAPAPVVQEPVKAVSGARANTLSFGSKAK